MPTYYCKYYHYHTYAITFYKWNNDLRSLQINQWSMINHTQTQYTHLMPLIFRLFLSSRPIYYKRREQLYKTLLGEEGTHTWSVCIPLVVLIWCRPETHRRLVNAQGVLGHPGKELPILTPSESSETLWWTIMWKKDTKTYKVEEQAKKQAVGKKECMNSRKKRQST